MAVAVVEGLNKSECMECSPGPKKVAVSGGLTVVPNSFQFSFSNSKNFRPERGLSLR